MKFGNDDQGAAPVRDAERARRRVQLMIMPTARLRALARLRVREAGQTVIVAGSVEREDLIKMIIKLEQETKNNER